MDILVYILKSGVVLALFYSVYHFILRKDTFFTSNRHFLLIGVLVSILVPLIVITNTTIVEIEAAGSLVNTENIPFSNSVQNEHQLAIDWWSIGLLIYGAGVIFMSFRFIRQLFSLVRLINNLPSEKNNGFTHLISNSKVTPFSFFKYIVYNPELHQPEDLKMIIKHEQAHASQWHSIDVLIASLFLIFQWMNPFAWLYKKGMEENLEFIADSETAQRVKSKKEYQLTLVKVLSTSINPSLTNNFYQSLIKKRIVMLHKNASKAYNQWKIAIILPLLAIFLWSFNVKEVINYKKIPSENIIEMTTPTILEEIDPIDNFIEKFDNKSNMTVNPELTKVEKLNNEITMTVDKNTTDDELNKIKKIFKDHYNVTINFSDVVRNSNGEITSIKVDMKAKSANANFYEENDDGIKSFQIYYNDETNKIKIGNTKDHDLHFKSKGEHVFIMEIDEDEDGNTHILKRIKEDKDGNEEIIIKEVHGNHIILDEDVEGNTFHFKNGDDEHKKVWISKDGNKKIHTDHEVIVIESNDDSGYFFMDDKDKDALIFIDGKKSSYKDLKKLGKGKIETIEIIKGDNAIKEYGKKAKDGVIKVTTKK